MKLYIQILCFLGVLFFVTSCNKYEPLTPRSNVDSTTELKTVLFDQNISELEGSTITDPENEDDITVTITDPENEEDKESN